MDLSNNPFERSEVVFGTAGDHDNRPALAFEYELLRAHCRDAFQRRKATYPELVRKNQIDEDLARRDMVAWRQLAVEWHWVITGEGELPGPETLPDRIAAVNLAASRISEQLARNGGNDDLWHQQSAIAALAWHLGRLRHGQPAVHHFADLNRRLRQAMQTIVCPACERRREDPRVAACTRRDCGLPHQANRPEAERNAA